MPTNNFKLFDQNKANLLSDTEYANDTQRLNGVQTGVASSQLNNKFAYQVSLVAYAIAQIMNQNGLDASDTLSVSAFVGNLGGSLLQKVADRASSAEAASGVLANKYISPATMKAAALLLSGGVMNGTLNMNNNKIINLPSPSTPSEPATKEYVDGRTVIIEEKITDLKTNRNSIYFSDTAHSFLLKCKGIPFIRIRPVDTFTSKSTQSEYPDIYSGVVVNLLNMWDSVKKTIFYISSTYNKIATFDKEYYILFNRLPYISNPNANVILNAETQKTYDNENGLKIQMYNENSENIVITGEIGVALGYYSIG